MHKSKSNKIGIIDHIPRNLKTFNTIKNATHVFLQTSKRRKRSSKTSINSEFKLDLRFSNCFSQFMVTYSIEYVWIQKPILKRTSEYSVEISFMFPGVLHLSSTNRVL